VSWFDILKELQSKTGYAQLDFDNIVEEEEDNCKRRWQRIGNALDKKTKETIAYFTEKVYGKEPKEITLGSFGKPSKNSGKRFDFEDNGNTDMIIFYYYLYDAEIPEEVYCGALEDLDRNATRIGHKIKGYNIISTFEARKINKYYIFENESLEYFKKVDIYLEGKLMANLGFRIIVRDEEKEFLDNLVKMFDGVIT
jgi:hypothetical protein